MALEFFKIDADLHRGDTRLRQGAEKGVDILTDENESLKQAGLKNGTALTLERGAAPQPDMLTVRVCVVTGNDPSPKLNPERPGNRGPILEVEIFDKDTVVELKERMMAVAGLSCTEVMRIRMTNWSEEAGNLVHEYDHDSPSPLIFRKTTTVKAGDLFLLEEGRVPRVGDLTFQIFLWDAFAPTRRQAAGGPSVTPTEPNATAEVLDEDSIARRMKMRFFHELHEVDCSETAPLALFRHYIFSMLTASEYVQIMFPGVMFPFVTRPFADAQINQGAST
jgi:hypothetical protein